MAKTSLPDGLEALIGTKPEPPALYMEALTHGSEGDSTDYQRLEFLGDRVLGLSIAHALFDRFKDEPEGKLSARFNALISRETCAEVARSLGIADLIIMGKQARSDGGRDSDNILGDVVESLIGAHYLAVGFEGAKALVLKWWGVRISQQSRAPSHPKSALQEWAAANRKKPPEYSIVERGGPAHAPVFTVEVKIHKLGSATGIGTSKQEAEKDAAEAMLDKIMQGKPA